jgi:hypothetical protein
MNRSLAVMPRPRFGAIESYASAMRKRDSPDFHGSLLAIA